MLGCSDTGKKSGGASGGDNGSAAQGGTETGGSDAGDGDAGTAGNAGGSAGTDSGVTIMPSPPEVDRRLFDVTAKPSRIDLTVSAAAEQSLRADPSIYVEGTFKLQDKDGTVGPLTVGVRGKGAIGSRRGFDEKMAFKVDFDRIVAKQELFGLGKVNLNNLVQDASAIHEWLAYELFTSQGVPVPRVGYTRVFVNGKEFGVYLIVEATDDKAFLKRNLESTQALYEGEYDQDLYVGKEGEFELDKGVDPDRKLLTTLTNALANAASNQVYTGLSTLVKWNEVLSEIATEMLTGHWDGYAAKQNNYFLHFDDQGKVSLLPWGTDQTFVRSIDPYAGRGLLFTRCLEDPTCKTAYDAALAAARKSGTAFVKDRATELCTLASRLAVELKTDPRWPYKAAEVTAKAEAALALLTCESNPNADTDGDGARCARDCGEGNPALRPGATEICGDGIDQDCNAIIDDGACPECGPSTVLGKSYLFCRGLHTRAEAVTLCQTNANGSKLVKIDSAAENAAVSARAIQYFAGEPFWLGLTDASVEGTWVWSDNASAGKASSCSAAQSGNLYCSWAQGEPNDNQNEDCAQVLSDGRWNDIPCSNTLQTVCELLP